MDIKKVGFLNRGTSFRKDVMGSGNVFRKDGRWCTKPVMQPRTFDDSMEEKTHIKGIEVRDFKNS